jgi:hypothetical protein
MEWGLQDNRLGKCPLQCWINHARKARPPPADDLHELQLKLQKGQETSPQRHLLVSKSSTTVGLVFVEPVDGWSTSMYM